VSGKEAVIGGGVICMRSMVSHWFGEERTLGVCGGKQRLSLLVWEALDIYRWYRQR
jgi:hypothetical protein